MLQSHIAPRPNVIATNKGEELALVALADIEEAATAWLTCATFRDLFNSQSEKGQVSAERCERAAHRIADDFDTATASFRRSDRPLRREEQRLNGLSELADPQCLVYAAAAAERGIPAHLFETFVRQIGGAPTLGLLDKHGLYWILRFGANRSPSLSAIGRLSQIVLSERDKMEARGFMVRR